MVRLGVRVIHKVPAETKLFQLPNNSNSTILPRTLRLRLSPKALKLANKFTTASTTNNVDGNETGQMKQDNLGAMSRIDVGGAFQRVGESKVSFRLHGLHIWITLFTMSTISTVVLSLSRSCQLLGHLIFLQENKT